MGAYLKEKVDFADRTARQFMKVAQEFGDDENGNRLAIYLLQKFILSTYEQWMPDFMAGLAQGIDKNKSKVTDAIKGLSTDMSVGLNLNNLNKIPVATDIGQGIINNRNNSNQGINNNINSTENKPQQVQN